MELDGGAGEALQAQRGVIPGCAFAATLFQPLLVGALREVRAAHPTVSVRVVVDDLSLQRFDDHNRVAQELERASTCMAANLMQAGCEIATKKSKVLSNSISVAGMAAAAWRAGDADRTDPRNRLRVREASDHSGATGAAGEVQRIRKVHGKSSVPWRRRLAQTAHACTSVKSKPLRCGGHSAQWNGAAAVPVADGVLLGEADAWQERNNDADDGGKRAQPGVWLLGTRDRHACAVGRLDAAGHNGKSPP